MYTYIVVLGKIPETVEGSSSERGKTVFIVFLLQNY